MKPIQILEVSGAPRERGYQYGTRLKDQTQKFLKEEFYDYYSKEGISKQTLINYAQKHIPFVEEYSPESIEVIKGVAEGAETLLEEILLINMHEEINKFVPKEKCPLYSHHCTAFGATGPATVGRETYIGQNWDSEFPLERYWGGDAGFLLHEKRPHGPNVLAYDWPGLLAGTGMNSIGISLCWNSVPRNTTRVGVPTYILVSELLRSKNIGEALASVVRAKRAGSFNFVLADNNGEVYDIEATPEDLDMTYVDKAIGHANHFLTEKFIKHNDWNMSYEGTPNLTTVVRQNRMDKMLAQNFGSIDLETCKTFLRDHVNHPYSICSHATDTKWSYTCDSWIMVPSKQEWWLARYPPCQNEYQKFIVN